MGTLALPSRVALRWFQGAVVVFTFASAPAPALAADDAKPASDAQAATAKTTRTLGVVLYPRFELLDVYGPVEMFGALGNRVKIVMVGYQAGPIASAQGPKVVADCTFEECPPLDLILVPGGFGTATQLGNESVLNWLRERADQAEIVMSVCSGSALLAKAGLLDGRRATSNKQFFQFAEKQGPKVQWVKEARWVEDGNRVTSSGVSAGMDMALAVIARLYGEQAAEQIANGTEYQWHRDANVDPFARFAK